MSQNIMNDIWHMRSALNLARTGLGRTAPNPTVGCVIVDSAGYIVGRARTADGGRPHAETIALEQAGGSAKGACAYVTLEPCSHKGKTGPCSQALIDAGVKRVVIAITDPDARVAGQGIKMLETAGIEVVTNILKDEAYAINEGYFLARTQNRPLVTLKTATSLDSKIATSSGESKWITGEAARYAGHVERAQHDAIIVGVDTTLADKPSLLPRINGVQYKGKRIVFDTNLRLAGSDWFFDTVDKNPAWIFTSLNEDDDKAKSLTEKGAKVISVPKSGNHVDITKALEYMALQGLTRVMVEGGATLVSSFIQDNAWDRLLWFRNDSVLGDDGRDAISTLGIDKLENRIKLQKSHTTELDEDRLDVYRNNHR